MSKCIYCKETLVLKGDVPHPKNPSLEHIVPWALGGSNDCATWDACTECNSKLGETVDADCINQSIVTMVRQEFGIVSYSNKVPDLQLDARTTEGNEPARISFPHQGTPRFDHKPVVIRQDESFGEKVFVVGNEEDVRRIVQGLETKAAKKDMQLLDPSTGKPLNLASSIANAERDTFGEYKAEIVTEMTAIRRELVKIAFGFAHLAMGWSWTGSPEAEDLRRVARGAGDQSDVNRLVSGVDAKIRSKFPMGSAKSTDHLLALIPLGTAYYIIVSLFGEPVLTTRVLLTVSPEALEVGIPAGKGVMATIDPQTRKARWVSLYDFTVHMASQV